MKNSDLKFRWSFMDQNSLFSIISNLWCCTTLWNIKTQNIHLDTTILEYFDWKDIFPTLKGSKSFKSSGKITKSSLCNYTKSMYIHEFPHTHQKSLCCFTIIEISIHESVVIRNLDEKQRFLIIHSWNISCAGEKFIISNTCELTPRTIRNLTSSLKPSTHLIHWDA